jgi:hypothetical protein
MSKKYEFFERIEVKFVVLIFFVVIFLAGGGLTGFSVYLPDNLTDLKYSLLLVSNIILFMGGIITIYFIYKLRKKLK